MIVVRQSQPGTKTCIGIVLCGLALAGCGPGKKAALPQPPPPKADRWGTQAAISRVKELSREADNLATDAHQLPGSDAADHSRIMQRIFTDLLHVLPLMGNATEDRVLAQQLTIIQTSRASLASGTNDRIEPAIDTALRAADRALTDLSHTDPFEQADVGKELDSLLAVLNGRLDFERDPVMHRVDVTQAVDLISEIVSKLAASLSGRLTVEQHSGPSTAASAPTTEPTAAPATQPSAPASEPAATAPAAPAQPATPDPTK